MNQMKCALHSKGCIFIVRPAWAQSTGCKSLACPRQDASRGNVKVLKSKRSNHQTSNRPLGIPTVIDRLIQRAISQVLSPICKKQFHDNSYGFRPKRGCHGAIKQSQEHISQGYKYVVYMDIETFFDTVNQSKLIEVLGRTIKDGRVISLIHKYLRAGIVVRHRYEETLEGVPQGGPLSPLCRRPNDILQKPQSR